MLSDRPPVPLRQAADAHRVLILRASRPRQPRSAREPSRVRPGGSRWPRPENLPHFPARPTRGQSSRVSADPAGAVAAMLFTVTGITNKTLRGVRDSVVSDAARQLTTRLGIMALTSDDLARLEALHPCELALDAPPVSWLFDRSNAAQVLDAFTGLDRRLKPLLDYRDFGYWLFDEHRNPVQLVENLRACASRLDPRNPRHLALVLDMTWLYLVTLAHAVHAIRAAHIANPDRGLQEYLCGGAMGLREKEGLSRLLAEMRTAGALPAEVNVDPLPTYYAKLLELVTRVMRRPDRVLPALRLLEVLTAVTAMAKRVTPAGLGALHEDLAAKQAADVVGFLVTTANLDLGFRARSLLLGEAFAEPALVEQN